MSTRREFLKWIARSPAGLFLARYVPAVVPKAASIVVPEAKSAWPTSQSAPAATGNLWCEGDVICLRALSGELRTDMIDVTCWGDSKATYIPGAKRLSVQFWGSLDDVNRVARYEWIKRTWRIVYGISEEKEISAYLWSVTFAPDSASAEAVRIDLDLTVAYESYDEVECA